MRQIKPWRWKQMNRQTNRERGERENEFFDAKAVYASIGSEAKVAISEKTHVHFLSSCL